MKNKFTPYFLSLLLVGVFVMLIFVKQVQAAPKAITGYAWSNNVGWMHMDHGPGGVSLDDTTGILSGYAWADHIGWIQFNPAVGFPAAPAYGARINMSTGQASGWAKALTANGNGWDGWINLSGGGQQVSVNLGSGNFSGYAWGSDVVGWVDFSGVSAGIACTPLTYRPATSGLSLNSDGTGITNSLSILSGQTFYAYVDYGAINDSIIGPASGSNTCAWNNWVGASTVGRFDCSAPAAPGSYSYISGTTNYPLPGSNICASVSPSIGTVTVASLPTATITADNYNPPYNGQVTISWSSTNASSCIVDPTGWTGTSGSQTVTNLLSDKNYTLSCLPGPVISGPIFIDVQDPPTYNLRVEKSGQGIVTGNIAPNISCGTNCSGDYPADTVVVLTASSNSVNRRFTGWGIPNVCDSSTVAPDGSGGTCTITVNGNKIVYPNFIVNPGYKEF